MSVQCPSCGEENDNTANYCYFCGSSLGGDEIGKSTIGKNEETTRTEESSKTTRRRGRKALEYLVELLVLLIALPIVYIYLGRPVVERKILQIAESAIGENPARFEFHDDMRNEIIQEEDINEELSRLLSDIPLIERGKIDLDQDNIQASLYVFNIYLRLGLDVRVNDQGDVFVKTIETNLPLRLLFNKKTLQVEVSDIINREYLLPTNMALKAFQVTDGEIFLTIEQR